MLHGKVIQSFQRQDGDSKVASQGKVETVKVKPRQGWARTRPWLGSGYQIQARINLSVREVLRA